MGELTLEDVEFVPLVRPLQCVGIFRQHLRRQDVAGDAYEFALMNAEQAEEVMDLYVEAITQVDSDGIG